MSKGELNLDQGRPGKLSTASVALGIALIPLLLIYKAKADPVAEFLWLFSHPHDNITVYFWQGRLADLLSIGLLASLVYAGLRRSGIDARFRPNGIVHALIGVGFALPFLVAAVALYWAVKQGALADLYGALIYGDGGELFALMLMFETMAMIMLVLANWVDIRFVVRRRRVVL